MAVKNCTLLCLALQVIRKTACMGGEEVVQGVSAEANISGVTTVEAS